MLTIDISQIPQDGLEVDEALAPSEVHVEGEESFRLAPGGSLRGRIDRGDAGGVHVRGRLSASLELECGRCLEPFAFPLHQDLDLFFLPHSKGAEIEEEDEVELKDRDMVVAYYDGDRLDLGEVIREQLFLAAPLKPLCHEDCKGRCPSCSIDKNRASCSCPPPASDVDVRLLELKKIFDGRSH
jgi:uncharacterized protein